MQVPKMQVQICKGRKCKYGKCKYKSAGVENADTERGRAILLISDTQTPTTRNAADMSRICRHGKFYVQTQMTRITNTSNRC